MGVGVGVKVNSMRRFLVLSFSRGLRVIGCCSFRQAVFSECKYACLPGTGARCHRQWRATGILGCTSTVHPRCVAPQRRPAPPPWPPSPVTASPAQVESLPPALLSSRVSLEDFMRVHHMQRKMHSLQVALDFYQQVGEGWGCRLGVGMQFVSTRWRRAGSGATERARVCGVLAARNHHGSWGRAGTL